MSVRINTLNFIGNNNVSVSIFDGPIFVRSSTLNDINHFQYDGGNEVTCGIDVLNGDVPDVDGLEIVYTAHKQTLNHVKLSNVDDTFNITVNTRQRHGAIFYYKYLKVKAENSFVKMTFTKVHSLSGTSYNCKYGGVVFSDLSKFAVGINGPYCSQYGTSPLGNDVNTFYSMQNYLIFLIYSYTFQINVEIFFQRSHCEGITNMPNLLCGDDAVYKYVESPPINYIHLGIRTNKLQCIINIQIIKGCVIVQRLFSVNNAVRLIAIDVRAGKMLTALQVNSNFRYV